MNIKIGTWNVRTMHERQDRNLERSNHGMNRQNELKCTRDENKPLGYIRTR